MTKETVYTTDVLAWMEKWYTDIEADTVEAADKARAEVVDKVAEYLGVSAFSVRAKMNSEGYYIAKTNVNKKTGEKPEDKATIVEHIATLIGVQSSENLPGLDKANKATLVAIRAALRAAAEVVFEESETEPDPEPETSS